MDVQLLYLPGCPNWRLALDHLAELTEELELGLTIQPVVSTDDAANSQMTGSPTILIDGKDPWAGADTQPSYSCRVFDTPDGAAGSPSKDQLRAALTS